MTVDGILSVGFNFDFNKLSKKNMLKRNSFFSSGPMHQLPMPSQCHMSERIHRQEIHLLVSG